LRLKVYAEPIVGLCSCELQLMSQRIVFVGGIHGAGKTTVSRLLAGLLSASHITAGGLIRETASVAHTVTVGVGDKAVPDVDANQALLLRGLDLYRARIGVGPILLDGHFSLLDPSGAVVGIPMAVYHAISPAAVLLVEADAQTVHDRLMRRDGAAAPLGTVSLLASRERECAEAVCAALRIPMWTIAGDTMAEQTAEAAASYLRQFLDGAA
jgi:adenylate kinase